MFQVIRQSLVEITFVWGPLVNGGIRMGTHADMQDSIGLMKDKKVASKENFLSILFTWGI